MTSSIESTDNYSLTLISIKSMQYSFLVSIYICVCVCYYQHDNLVALILSLFLVITLYRQFVLLYECSEGENEFELFRFSSIRILIT